MSKLKQNALKLSRRAFQTWLESLHPRTKVGIPGDGDACPIARFVIAQTGNRDINVGHYTIILNYSKEYTDDGADMPRWAQAYISHVDSTGLIHITAARALKILKAIR